MAEPEVRISTAPEESGDVDMQGGDKIEAPETGAADEPGEEDTETQNMPARVTFVE